MPKYLKGSDPISHPKRNSIFIMYLLGLTETKDLALMEINFQSQKLFKDAQDQFPV
jgi:hypothetical protein